jgi:hypothetical protein
MTEKTQKPEEDKKSIEPKKSTKVQKPTIGRTVHFLTEEGETLPAVVTQVHEDGTVNLRAFTNNDFSPPAILIKNVSEGNNDRQWSWPPRDGE